MDQIENVSTLNETIAERDALRAELADLRVLVSPAAEQAMRDLRADLAAAKARNPVRWMVVRDSNDPDEYFETAAEAGANACFGLATTRVIPLYAAIGSKG